MQIGLGLRLLLMLGLRLGLEFRVVGLGIMVSDSGVMQE